MDAFLFIVILTLIIISVVVAFFLRKRKTAITGTEPINGSVEFAPVEGGDIFIPIERIATLSVVDERSLVEIKDKFVIARITQTIPTVAEKAAKTVTNQALKKTDIYRVVIPNGETLVKSKDMAGAARGFFRGAKGVKGQANLVKVDHSKITKASTVANIGANVMNVGSLVVGQYYMSEISAKLEAMNKNISKISDFQDREFKSRTLSLMSLVGEVSQFSTEIIENDEVRTQKIASLENMKANATELLGQVNDTMTGIVQSNLNSDYKTYQEKVDEFNILVEYQSILLAVLEKISELAYLLGKGSMPMLMCYSLYEKYCELSVQARDVLEAWHNKQIIALKIDLEKNRKIKNGFDGVISSIPALWDDNWKYKDLKYGMADKITSQTQSKPQTRIEQKAVFDDNVQIIIKDGKYFLSH